MCKRNSKWIFLVAVFFSLMTNMPGHVYAQTWSIDLNLSENSVFQTSLEFGVDADGTDGIDTALGENELPPKPPAGIFDARFIGSMLGNGSLSDIRDNASDIYEWIIDIQREAGGEVRVAWSTLPSGVFVLEDMFGGLIFSIDMTSQSSYTITNTGITQLKIKYSAPQGQVPTIESVEISPNTGYAKVGDTVTISVTAGNNEIGLIPSDAVFNNKSVPLTDRGDGTYTGTYTVIEGDDDTINAETTNITLTGSGGTSDTSSSAGSTLIIDANRPVISSVTINPSSGTVSAGDTVEIVVSAVNNETGLIAANASINGKLISIADLGDGTYRGYYLVAESDNYTVNAEAANITLTDTAGNVSAPVSSSGSTLIILPQPLKVEAPIFDPSPGSFTTIQNVQLSCPTAGASVYYTTNGSDPTEDSALYTSAISLTSTTVLKARAYKTDYNPSDIATGTYIISGAIKYSLAISVTPPAGGTTSPEAGTHSYEQNSVVTLTAIPSSGYRFIGWTGDMAETVNVSTTITMSGNKTVTAQFELIPQETYTLTIAVDPDEGGTTVPSTGEYTCTSGERVDVMAIPAEGYDFDMWTIQTVDKNTAFLKVVSNSTISDPDSASSFVIMDSDMVLIAHFTVTDPDTLQHTPVIVTTSLPDAQVGKNYVSEIVVEDHDEDDTHTFYILEGPEWLSIDSSTGELSGTPEDDDVGSDIPVRVRVIDSGELSAEFSTVIKVTNGGTGSLTGMVIDRYTGKPVENAVITCGNDYNFTTDESGEYKLADIPEGIYIVEVTAHAYQPFRNDNVVIADDQITELKIELIKSLGYGSINGSVKDLNTDLPIENTVITVFPGNFTAVSDVEGYYIIEDLLAGTSAYSLTVSARNYYSNNVSRVYVDNGRTTSVNVSLAEEFTPNADSIIIDVDEYPVVDDQEILIISTKMNLSSISKLIPSGLARKKTSISQDLYVAGAELYFDIDPGVGNGYTMEAVDGAFDEEIEEVTLTYDISGLEDGTHTLYVRGLNSEKKWGYPNTNIIKKGIIYEPPLSVETFDVPDDNGHAIGIKWDPSISENEGLISGYRIYRSRNSRFNEPIALSEVMSVESLLIIELSQAVLLDSVSVGINQYTDSAVWVSGAIYFYWIQATGPNGTSKLAPNSLTTKIEINNVPIGYSLKPPYPNPFNPVTTIQYELQDDSHVMLTIHNTLGEKIKVLQNEYVNPGIHTIVWDATDNSGVEVGSGIYLFHFKANNYVANGKLLLIR